MPLIDVSMLEGRTKEQKAKLIKDLTDAMVESIGVKPESVRVIIRDVPADQWGAGGVTMAELRKT